MRNVIVAVVAALALLAANPAARAQTAPQATASPEALAAAHELMTVMKPEDRFKAVVHSVMQNLKPAVVQGRPEVEKRYDAMMPVFLESAQNRFKELSDAIASIYASNFTAEETTFSKCILIIKSLDCARSLLSITRRPGKSFWRGRRSLRSKA